MTQFVFVLSVLTVVVKERSLSASNIQFKQVLSRLVQPVSFD